MTQPLMTRAEALEFAAGVLREAAAKIRRETVPDATVFRLTSADLFDMSAKTYDNAAEVLLTAAASELHQAITGEVQL